MDLHRYDALRRHWRRSPPLQQMVQAYMGIQGEQPTLESNAEPMQRNLSPDDEDAAIRDFMANFAAAGGCVT